MLSKNKIKWLHSLQHKKFRQKYGLFLAEGEKLVKDLLDTKLRIHSIFALQDFIQCIDSRYLSHTEVITGKELVEISTLQSPQQVIAVFHIPVAEVPILSPHQNYLALDNIRDPGNMGTIIRIADWFGINTLFANLESVDFYNPKVVQCSMGSLGRVHLIETDLISLVRTEGLISYSTSLEGKDIRHITLKPGLILMGNESQGVNDTLLRECDHLIKIPGRGKAESLNVAVATGIICHHFTNLLAHL